MPMVSYSQNLEDVILQRALRYVQKGCYVDVGASLPDTDSLSYAFLPMCLMITYRQYRSPSTKESPSWKSKSVN